MAATDLDNLKTEITAYIAAIDSGDVAAQVKAIQKAAAYLALIPDSEFRQAKLQYDRKTILQLARDSQGQSTTAGGLSVSKIEWTATSD